MQNKITTAVVGASSITGGEICRLLLGHPMVSEIIPLSRSPGDFERTHMNLMGSRLSFVQLDDYLKSAYVPDVVFFSTPSGEAMQLAEAFLDKGSKVIDVSGDFRFSDPFEYENVYEKKHVAPHLLPKAVCGITEMNRDTIRKADLVANPGCYVIATILGLWPLLQDDITCIDSNLFITAINGTTGAGSKCRKELHHPYADGNMFPYNISGHRHKREIQRRIHERKDDFPIPNLTTLHGNFARGIISVIALPLTSESKGAYDRTYFLEKYARFYEEDDPGMHFVRVNRFSQKFQEKNKKEYDIFPSLARVIGSNFCDIGLDVDLESNTLKIISVIDNLIKGAAGSAIQNMNIMFNFDETEGIKAYGL